MVMSTTGPTGGSTSGARVVGLPVCLGNGDSGRSAGLNLVWGDSPKRNLPDSFMGLRESRVLRGLLVAFAASFGNLPRLLAELAFKFPKRIAVSDCLSFTSFCLSVSCEFEIELFFPAGSVSIAANSI